MGRKTKLAVGAVAGSLAGWMGLAPLAQAETTQALTIVAQSPQCVGNSATVSWVRPDVAGLLAYRVDLSVTTMNPPSSKSVQVPAEQTSLAFVSDFGLTIINVYAITAEGAAATSFASGSLLAGQRPIPTQWDWNGAAAGARTALVPYRWGGATKAFVVLGGMPTKVTVTASPGGASTTLDAAAPGGVVASFAGLTNGVGYVFSAVTSNACGSAAGGSSPTYTPGVRPTWDKSTPPLSASKGSYSYRFTAKGDPAPVLTLRNAPAWLTIASNGLVSGKPPAGTTSFSYSVVASNGVGVAFYELSDVVAGPFTVWASGA